MKRSFLRRLGIGPVVAALLVTATPGPLGAQGTGNNGGDNSRTVESGPQPNSSGGSVVSGKPTFTNTPGAVLPGQDDVPEDEQLHMPDKITLSATVAGTGGGPTKGGGQCEHSSANLLVTVQLPVIVPSMDPPAPPAGRGGVVTVPTWLWATFLSNEHLTGNDQQQFMSCKRSAPDPITGQTWWSDSPQTATLVLDGAPNGTVRWDFGDGDVGATCAGSGAAALNTLGGVEQTTIQHTYCVSSKRGPHSDRGYPVWVRAYFAGSGTLDTTDGSHEVEPLLAQTQNLRRYPVREVQAVLDE